MIKRRKRRTDKIHMSARTSAHTYKDEDDNDNEDEDRDDEDEKREKNIGD